GTGANPSPPYASWVTAATNIQDAVDAAALGGTVLVTNGVYANGGRAVLAGENNRVVVDKTLTLRSFNGPASTLIEGDNTTRGVYLSAHAVLDGFTITKGSASEGGGVWSGSAGVITNCVIVGNSASKGGGVTGGVLFGSLLANNSGALSGGGANRSILHNCT